MNILPELTRLIHFVKQVVHVRIATLPNADENHLVIIKSWQNLLNKLNQIKYKVTTI